MTASMTLDDLLSEANWLELRSQALPPQRVTELHTDEQTRAEFVHGARILRLDQGGKFVLAHQLLIADALNAGAETNAILVPRRSAKTTTVLIVVLGRCQEWADYQAAITLTTTASKTADRFRMDVIQPIERTWPDRDTRPMMTYLGKGSESLRWASGSTFAALTPNGDAFRSSAYDLVNIDEAGEAKPEQGEDLNGAIYPTFDTRDGAQAVFSGTAGRYRAGNLLWDALNEPGAGVVLYGIDSDTPEEELMSWTPTAETPEGHVRDLVLATHPGVATGLTTLDKIENRFRRLGWKQFAQEYLGVFGQVGGGTQVVSPGAWEASGEDVHPAPPARHAMAMTSRFDQGAASIVAAWRDDDGKACGLLLDHRGGTTWLADDASSRARRHNIPIVYDGASSPIRIEVEAMNRMNPRPRFAPQTTQHVTAAAALLIKEINTGNARHWKQPQMDEAARIAVRRPIGAQAWALGRPARQDGADISALEAWALALRYYDENPQQSSFRPIVAM